MRQRSGENEETYLFWEYMISLSQMKIEMYRFLKKTQGEIKSKVFLKIVQWYSF